MQTGGPERDWKRDAEGEEQVAGTWTRQLHPTFLSPQAEAPPT